MSVSMFALAQRSLSAVRVVLPAAPTVSLWSRRYSGASTAHVNSSKQPGMQRQSTKLVALESEPSDTSSIDGLRPALGTSQLPLANTSDISQSPVSEETYAAAYIPGRSIYVPFLHPRTHSIPVATIHFRSYHTELLEIFTHFASHAATALGIPISRVVKLPTRRSLWTVPRSPFVHKKSQENFERKVHKRLIKAWDADQEVVEKWTRYLRKHGMGGVGMRVVRWERTPLGIGRRKLGGVGAQLAAREETAKGAEIKNLGENIIKRELSA